MTTIATLIVKLTISCPPFKSDALAPSIVGSKKYIKYISNTNFKKIMYHLSKWLFKQD